MTATARAQSAEKLSGAASAQQPRQGQSDARLMVEQLLSDYLHHAAEWQASLAFLKEWLEVQQDPECSEEFRQGLRAYATA